MDSKKGTKYNKKPIKYAIDWSLDEKVILPKYAYSHIVCSHTKRYHNCLYLLAGLNGCSRDLMDYITEEMDSENIFYSNAHFRQRFIRFILENGTVEKLNKESGAIEVVAVRYSDSNVKKALAALAEKNLIRSVSKGVFKVNPEYFFKNDDSKRLDMIRLEMEFKSGSDTKLKMLQEAHPDKKTLV